MPDGRGPVLGDKMMGIRVQLAYCLNRRVGVILRNTDVPCRSILSADEAYHD